MEEFVWSNDETYEENFERWYRMQSRERYMWKDNIDPRPLAEAKFDELYGDRTALSVSKTKEVLNVFDTYKKEEDS